MDGIDVASIASNLLGEHGGLFGLGAILGATAAWTFAMKTVFKLVEQERERCEAREAVHVAEKRELTERYIASIESELQLARQYAQLQGSAMRTIRRKAGEDG